MEKVESALEVLSRAATMVRPCYPVSDSDSFESPSTASSGEWEGAEGGEGAEAERTRSPERRAHALPGKWRPRRAHRLPDYVPRESCKMALRSQSFTERRRGGTTRVHPHSDGELSDAAEDAAPGAPARGGVLAGADAAVDMRLRSRPAPPCCRPSVIKAHDSPTGSVSMIDPVIEEHFRRSLGDNYMNLFKKNSETPQTMPKPNMKDRASSPIHFNPEPPKPTKIIAMDVDDASVSVDDHFAKALGDTWKQIQTSRLRDNEKTQDSSKGVVDDHFSKALGDTWKKIQSSKLIDSNEKKKDQTTKIISRSGVVI